MARVTRVTGIILIVLGAVYFFVTGAAHPTALIPTYFGLVLLVCGALANTTDNKRVALWMHIAVTVGLVGCLFPGFRAVKAFVGSVALTPVKQTAATESLIMAVICGLFTAFCVRSFIANRVARTAGVPAEM